MDRRFFENDEEDNSSERYHRYNDEYIYVVCVHNPGMRLKEL